MKLTSGHFASNSQAILSVLQHELAESAKVLEVASGCGQHADYFAATLPATVWQPSEIDPQYLPSIRAYANDALNGNLHLPLQLDVREQWPVETTDAIVSINLLHVSGWDTCCGLLRNAGRVLPAGGLLFFYGPFIRPDVETAPSNRMFHMRLQQRDPEWGVPELEKVAAEAGRNGISLKAVHELPSNNVMVVFIKD